MATKYPYTVDVELFDVNQLTHEIKLNSTITTPLEYINFTRPDLDLYFSSDLSGAEETVLNSLISEFPNALLTKPKTTFSVQQIDVNDSSKNKSYRTLSRVVYLGSDFIGDIVEIDIISYMDTSIDSYDVRVVDVKNSSTIIAEINGLTNTEDEIISLGSINNLPEDKTRLDIQVRKNSGSSNESVYLDSVLIKY